MRQYRITTRSYAQDHIPDAAMDATDLARIKQLAGIGMGAGLLEDYSAEPGTSAMMNQDPGPSDSPVGTAPTATSGKLQLEKDMNIKVGTPEWFQLWFARPELTGEKPVGDDAPDAARNPYYLLDKEGRPEPQKVEALTDQIEKKNSD